MLKVTKKKITYQKIIPSFNFSKRLEVSIGKYWLQSESFDNWELIQSLKAICSASDDVCVVPSAEACVVPPCTFIPSLRETKDVH